MELVARARPTLVGAAVSRRVWRDGPPWFSCGEVLTKLKSQSERAVVRDQVGNWRELVVAGWVVLRDTSAGEVAEPGWCTARLLDDSARALGGWRKVHGDSLPSGSLRRGWDVPVGTRRISLAAAPRVVGHDSAAADVLVSIDPNANGTALAASRDTAHYRAMLVRSVLGWELGSLTPEPH